MSWLVLVTGSRKWTDYQRLAAVLDAEYVFHPDMVVRYGKARSGADVMAEAWCKENGVPQDPCPADWSQGLSAGFARNSQMVLKHPSPDICHAFIVKGKSPGTLDCAKKAKKAEIHVERHTAVA